MRVATALREIERGADNHMACGTQRPPLNRACAPRLPVTQHNDLFKIFGTAGWTRTTDLLIHSKYQASVVVRHDPSRTVADPAVSLVTLPIP